MSATGPRPLTIVCRYLSTQRLREIQAMILTDLYELKAASVHRPELAAGVVELAKQSRKIEKFLLR